MTILRIDAQQARKVFGARPPTPLEMRVVWSFKYPVDSELLTGSEFEQTLDDGATARGVVQEILDRLVAEGVLVPATTPAPAHQELPASDGLAGEVNALGLLASGIAGDLAAMGDWAQRRVAVGDRDVASTLASARRQLTELRDALLEARQAYVEEQTTTPRANGGLRLHLGCGSIRPPGWVNVDVIGGDIRMNLCWELPFADGSVSHVYSANTFEHLDFHTSAPRLLHEIRRVLAPGGVARLVMPDIGEFAAEYANGDGGFFEEYDRRRPAFAGLAGYRTPLAIVMRAAGSTTKALGWFEHKMGYDFETLKDMLRVARFDPIEHSRFAQSRDPALREMDAAVGETEFEQDRLKYSLFVDAYKPTSAQGSSQ